MARPCGCGGAAAEAPPAPTPNYEVEGSPELGTFTSLAEARRSAPNGSAIIPVIPTQ